MKMLRRIRVNPGIKVLVVDDSQAVRSFCVPSWNGICIR
jgi:hypothetical protein